MTTSFTPKARPVWLRLPRAAAATVIAIGTLGLIGWGSDLPILTSVLPGLSTMKANTAAALVLGGLSLWLSEGGTTKRVLGAGCAAVVAGIGLLTITEYLSGRDLGIDQLLVRDPTTIRPSFPGRMGLSTAMCLVLIGWALPRRDGGALRRPWFAEACAVAAAVIALIAMMGYAYSVTSLTGIASYTQMALHTALALLVLCTGVLARDRDGPLLRIALGDGPGSEVVRTGLPIMLALLFGLGWFRLKGQEAGWYGTQFGLAIMVLVSMVSLSVVTLWSAARLNRVDADRRVQTTALQQHAQILDLAHVLIRDLDGTIRFWNTGSEHQYGWTKAQAIGRISHQLLQTEFPESLAKIEAALLQAGHWRGELVHRQAQGQRIVVASHWLLHYDAGGRPIGVLEVNNEITDRKRIEARFRAVVESAASGMVMTDRDGRITLVNKETERLFGYSRDELLGQPIELLIPQPLRERHPGLRAGFVAAPKARAMGAGRDLFGVRRDGVEFPVEIGLNPIETEEGLFILASVVDITARKRAEARFRVVVESAPSGMVMIDRGGRITLVNKETEHLFGYTRDELLGQAIEVLVPQRLRERHPGLRTDFLADPKTRAMGAGRDLFGVRKDGEEFPVEIGLNPIETDEGLFVLASVVDITERKRVAAALQETEERLGFALQRSHTGGWDLDLRDHSAHRTLEHDRIFGYDALLPQWTYEIFLEHVVPEDRGEVDRLFQKAIEGQTDWSFECRIRRADGDVRWIWAAGGHQGDGKGAARRMAGIVQDITDRKRAEQELRRSNEELERFAYVASHDLQEPLRMVGSYVQLLGKRYRGRLDADADEFIGYALDGALRMQRLIEDLLAFSRVGTRGVALAPTDTNAVVEVALTSLRLAIDESGASVTHDRLPTVLGDAGQLTQLFQNLVSNALKFRGAEPPQVHVSAARHDAEWCFGVKDNGIGIDPQYFERIFVIFQRLHSREAYVGTGIGLAIAKKIVERHGGRIWVESEPDRGTTFWFTLLAEKAG